MSECLGTYYPAICISSLLIKCGISLPESQFFNIRALYIGGACTL